MKIVVADGFAVNPGDLSWESISAFGELEVHKRTPASEIITRCKNADIILSNKAPLDSSALSLLPKLKLICVLATGYNVIDTEAAREKNIVVCNVPSYGTASVAQHTFALLLELSNHVGIHSTSVAKGEWTTAPDWCYTLKPVTELEGKTLGVIGFGNIGRKVSELALAFGMKVLCHTPSKKKVKNITFSDIQQVFGQSDFIALHCPLKQDNFQFINKSLLQLMKPTAFLINTARGQLINEADLAGVLNEGRIAGAALDVLSAEPPDQGNPLLSAKNCIITPHIAWISREARQRIIDTTAENIRAFLHNEPVHVVN